MIEGRIEKKNKKNVVTKLERGKAKKVDKTQRRTGGQTLIVEHTQRRKIRELRPPKKPRFLGGGERQ